MLDNFSPHLSTGSGQGVGEWAEANDVELAYLPTSTSRLYRIEAQFGALRYFALDGTDHQSHDEQIYSSSELTPPNPVHTTPGNPDGFITGCDLLQSYETGTHSDQHSQRQ